MFGQFKYQSINLKNITLDPRNPRIVTLEKLESEEKIVEYLFAYHDLGKFIRKISQEGRNIGAERPYIVKDGSGFIVVEGNTRIAAYKVLTGLIKPPQKYMASAIAISEDTKKSLMKVDCSIAPNRDALLPIMASAHFGQGDKSKWGVLGSRKAVYDEWERGRKVAEIASAFNRTEGEIRELIIEYRLYMKAISYSWTNEEYEKITDPNIEFNPPIRFLQTSGHKAKLGISYDMINLEVKFESDLSKLKFKHLVKKLAINPTRGAGATAAWDQVFHDFDPSKSGELNSSSESQNSSDNKDKTTSSGDSQNSQQDKNKNKERNSGDSGSGENKNNEKTKETNQKKSNILFSYEVSINSTLLTQLMKEAKYLNCKNFPAAGTFLLRNIVESLLKHIID